MNAATPQSDEWRTPSWLFKALDTEFGFNFDAAASGANHLLPKWTSDIEAVSLDPSMRIFCNPPYSMIELFVLRALARECFWTLLLPVRTDSSWFRGLIEGRAEIRFLRKRVEFLDEKGEPAGSPRFASMIAIV